jgi:hypothetical protein
MGELQHVVSRGIGGGAIRIVEAAATPLPTANLPTSQVSGFGGEIHTREDRIMSTESKSALGQLPTDRRALLAGLGG